MKMMMGLFFVLSLSFQANAQTCQSLFADKQIGSFVEFRNIIQSHSSVPIERTYKNSSEFDKLDSQLKEIVQKNQSPGLLRRILNKIFRKNGPLTGRQLDALVDQLFKVTNESGTDELSLKQVPKQYKIARAVHEAILKDIMKKDLQEALIDYGYQDDQKRSRTSQFLKGEYPRLRGALWIAVNAPAMFLSGDILPVYFWKAPPIRVSPEVEELIRRNLLEGNFNGALVAIEPELKRVYGTRVRFENGYNMTRKIYNRLMMLSLAHLLLVSPGAEVLAPEASHAYQEVSRPVVQVLDDGYLDVKNAVERKLTDRTQLEEVVIEEVIKMKEESAGHKIQPGDPLYIETVNNIHRLAYDELENIEKPMARGAQ